MKVRVVGYHDQIEDPNALPFASVMGYPFISSGYGAAPNTHQLEGGESVLGLWIDGDDEQKPVITNVFMKSQQCLDGSTANLKSGDTPRGTNAASSKSINSPLTEFNAEAFDFQSDAGTFLYDSTSIPNYSFSSLVQATDKPKREDFKAGRDGQGAYNRALREYEKQKGLYDPLTGRNKELADIFTTNNGKGVMFNTNFWN